MVLGMEEVWGIQRKTPYLLICSLLRALPPASPARQALWEAEQTQKTWTGTSQVVQWLRICLPVPGTQVQSPGQGTKIP